MKAAVWLAPWKMVWTDRPDPILEPEDVLLGVRAEGLCATDVHIYEGKFPSAHPPLILGHEFAGEVAAVGQAVKGVQIGDRVTAEPFKFCRSCSRCLSGQYYFCPSRQGHGFDIDGGIAEYVAAPFYSLHYIPDGLSWEEAALIEPTAVVTYAMRRSRLRGGESILIIGDGFLGLLLVQFARAYGAGPIIIGGHHSNRLDLALRTGADVAVDSRKEDLLQAVHDATKGRGVDVVIEASGNAQVIGETLEAVSPGGRVVIFGVYGEQTTLDPNVILLKNLEVIGSVASPGAWPEALHVLDRKQVDLKPLITHRLPMSEALRAFEIHRQRLEDAIKIVLVGE